MTHTSTEQQPELLMKLADDYAEACFDQGLHQRTADDKPEAARENLKKNSAAYMPECRSWMQSLSKQSQALAD
jgi:hypothetical protein